MKVNKILRDTIKSSIFIILIIISIFIIIDYFQIDYLYLWNDIEAKLNRTFTYVYFILLFFVLFYLINTRVYLFLFYLILIIGGPLWVFLFFFLSNDPRAITLRNTMTIPIFSIISIGLTLSIIQIIKNRSKIYADNVIYNKYHIHEGFIGIILLLFGIIFWLLRIFISKLSGSQEINRLFLAVNSIFIYLFIFCGSFLIFRDWRDILHVKFIEKIDPSNQANLYKKSRTFNKINTENARFFKPPKIPLYHLGLILASFSQVSLIHIYDFIPVDISYLEQEQIVLINIFLIFLSGGMIGIDWFRIFGKCYPELSKEIEQILNDIYKNKGNSSSKIHV